MSSMGLSSRPAQAGLGPRVRLIRKKGRRVIENLDSVAAELAVKLPAARVSIMEGADLASKSLVWQVSPELCTTGMTSAKTELQERKGLHA